MIEAHGLVKRYGEKIAVNDFSFTAPPGMVTGFLGPNGAGKSTTMRMLMGLDLPTAGSATVNGKAYQDIRVPLQEVGALLEAKAVHTGRSARNHLLAMAATGGIGKARVDEVIEMTGLGTVANKRVGGFSLGMGQRLGIASALLGDPATLILDEPVNGLDPEGVLWVRNLVRFLASEGRTILLSSHLMSEMALTADRLVVIGKGKLIAEASMEEIIAAANGRKVVVRTPQATRLAELLSGPEITVTSSEASTLEIIGVTSEQIGDLAAVHGIALHQLTSSTGSLEDAYMAMTKDSVEYHSATPQTLQEGALR